MSRWIAALLLVFTFAPQISGGQVDLREHHLHFGCEIYEVKVDSKTGKRTLPKALRKFPGELCLFQADGSVVMTFRHRVAKFDEKMKELWSYPTRAHHQLNASQNGSEILVIGSEIVDVGDKKAGNARSDVLLILGQDGKLKKRFSLFEGRKQFHQKAWRDAVARRFPMIWNVERFQEAKWEITHVNTFYEIPENALGKESPKGFSAFQAGGYIVNDISLMRMFVLDRDLKKVLWQKAIRPEAGHMTHDTQILSNGNLLFYDNGTPERPFSQLVEHNLVSGIDHWTYPKSFDKAFYAKRWGGIQILKSGNILFTDITKSPRIVEIDRQGVELWSWSPPENTYLQQARIEDLSNFLSRNQGI